MYRDSFEADDDDFQFITSDQQIQRNLSKQINTLQRTITHLQMKLSQSQLMIKKERQIYIKDVARLTKRLVEIQSKVEVIPKLLQENQQLSQSLKVQKLKTLENQNELQKKKNLIEIIASQKDELNKQLADNQVTFKLKIQYFEQEIISLNLQKQQNLMKIDQLEKSCQEVKDENISLQQKLEKVSKQAQNALKLHAQIDTYNYNNLKKEIFTQLDSLLQKITQIFSQIKRSNILESLTDELLTQVEQKIIETSQKKQNYVLSGNSKAAIQIDHSQFVSILKLKFNHFHKSIKIFEKIINQLDFQKSKLASTCLQLTYKHEEALDENFKLRMDRSAATQEFFQYSEFHRFQKKELQSQLIEKDNQMKKKQQIYNDNFNYIRNQNDKLQQRIIKLIEDLEEAQKTIEKLHLSISKKQPLESNSQKKL